MTEAGLYVHVPFCKSKCGYCGFYSREIDTIGNISTELYKSYMSAVVRNLLPYVDSHLKFGTVFFGGGTPSLLYREVAEVVAFLRERGSLTADCEITAEANPDDVDERMLAVLREAGVNRLSLGVQSLDDSVLRYLGRRHDSRRAISAVESAHKAGFRVSLDIMLGIPGQKGLDAVHELPTEHISAYMFESERSLPEEETAKLYEQTVEELNVHGLSQYEISNFAIPGCECLHNLKYWNCEEYVGIGPAAHSYYAGKRFAVREDVESFINSPLQETYVTEENPGGFEERMMLKLRLNSGVCIDDCTSREWETLLQRAEPFSGEYVVINQENLSLTTKGFLVANRLIGELL